jgi:hypothetical protein
MQTQWPWSEDGDHVFSGLGLLSSLHLRVWFLHYTQSCRPCLASDKTSQPVARGQHVARDAVLFYPQNDILNKNTSFNIFRGKAEM